MSRRSSGRREWMSAQLFHPTGEQAHTIRYRRLVEIRWEKRVIWRDESVSESCFKPFRKKIRFVTDLVVGIIVG
jgi:hypothetical protein